MRRQRKFQLKPVLHAGEVSTIHFDQQVVLDKVTGEAVNGRVLVLWSRKTRQASIIVITMAGADGAFVFVPFKQACTTW